MASYVFRLLTLLLLRLFDARVLWNASQPIHEHSTDDAEDDERPHQSEVPPAVVVVRTKGLQKGPVVMSSFRKLMRMIGILNPLFWQHQNETG